MCIILYIFPNFLHVEQFSLEMLNVHNYLLVLELPLLIDNIMLSVIISVRLNVSIIICVM